MRHPLFLSLSVFILIISRISPAWSEEKKPVKPEKNEYPKEVVTTFMKGCGFTSSKEYCTCSLDKLRYTFAEFLEIDKSARETNKVPREVISMFQSCRTQVPN